MKMSPKSVLIINFLLWSKAGPSYISSVLLKSSVLSSMILISWIRKMKHGAIKKHSQEHTVREWQARDSNLTLNWLFHRLILPPRDNLSEQVKNESWNPDKRKSSEWAWSIHSQQNPFTLEGPKVSRAPFLGPLDGPTPPPFHSKVSCSKLAFELTWFLLYVKPTANTVQGP